MAARAGIVVTGTEVLTGRVRDRNGPWLSDRLLELGVELAHITICGDRPEDMTAQLAFMADQGVDLVITSGGLGPTADDLTAEIVGRFAGREMVLDPELEERIAEILRPMQGVDIYERSDGAILALFESIYWLQRLEQDQPDLVLEPLLAEGMAG